MLSREEESTAEQALTRRYGLGRALFEWGVDMMRVDMCYLEITPEAWSGEPTSGPSEMNDGGATAK